MDINVWINSLICVLAFVLLQTTNKGKISLCEYNEDYELVCRKPKMDERILLFFRYLAVFVNSISHFCASWLLLFKEMFLVQQGAGIQNLSILSDMYNYGAAISSSLFDMFYTIIGEPSVTL